MPINPYEQIPSFDPVVPPEQPQEEPAAPAIVLDRAAMLAEAHAWGKNFIKRSSEWRRSSFETQWLRWARNSECNYDPELAKKKESWQSKVVWPLTASHRENAQAQLYKTEIGPRPPFEVKAIDGIVPPEEIAPGADQSKNIQDLVLRERAKSEYETERNFQIDDKTKYGSGFSQAYFETDYQDRLVQEPIYEPLQMPWSDGGASLARSVTGQRRVIGYKPVVKQQVIYRGIRFRWISIWDVFPDPQALKIPGHPIGIRYKTTYEKIVEGANPQPDGSPGWVLPEAVEALKSVPSQENTPTDKQQLQAERQIAQAKIERTDYARELECYEIQARLPKKWVLINGEDIDNPEALIPARLRIHDTCVISILPSDSYDGEPDIYKDDYMPVAGQFYGMGVPEMTKDPQDVATETSCQRLDAGAIANKKCFAVVMKAVVDPKDFEGISNGGVIRLKANDGLTNIDQLFKSIDLGAVDRAAFIEPQEWERAAQERTSVTQTSLGTEDNTDTTLGAQKIQRGVTGDKLAYLGMLSEFGFQKQIFNAYLKLIYANYGPEDYAMALGPQRAATVTPMSPEQFALSYQYMPLGVFEMENKPMRAAQISNWVKTYGQAPWADVLGAAKEELRTMNIAEDKLILPEAAATQILFKADQMAAQKAQAIVQERDVAEAQKHMKSEKSKDGK